MKKILMVTAVFVLSVLVWDSVADAQKKSIRIGDKMPGFFLKDIKGNRFFLRDYIGEKAKFKHRALILSLSASYCKPCLKEIPEFKKMMEKYKDKGLGIYIIALEKESMAKKLIRETQTTLPVLIDRYLLIPKLIGRKGIPCTLLLDGDGTVKYINTGFNEKNAHEFIEKFENAVDRVLGSGGGDSAESSKNVNNP